jgi:homoserine kinase
MENKTVRTFAPASISNLGPGYDILGLAIDAPGDYVTARRRREKGLAFSLKTKQAGIPADPRRNVAAHVASLLLDELKPPFGVELVLEKEMPVGSGLGSSAASSAAAVFAVNKLMPKPIEKYALLRFVVEGERKAAGSPHADNAAPSLLGGLWLIRSYDPLDAISIPIRNSIVWVVVHPHLVVKTEYARGILPESVPLRKAVRQWGNVSGLTAGLIAGNAELVGTCVEDVIVEPARASLIAGFDDVKRAAYKAGALGCSISGSGPSMFAVARSMSSARTIGRAMSSAFRRSAHVPSDVYVSKVNMAGTRLVPSLRGGA